MENVTLTMRITAAEAAAAGLDQFGDTTVVVRPSELSQGARAALVSLCGQPVTSSSTMRYDPNSALVRRVLPLPLPVTTETVTEWLEANVREMAEEAIRAEAAKVERLEAERKAVREWAAKPDKELVRKGLGDDYRVHAPYSYPSDMSDFVRERVAKAKVLADHLNAECAENVARANKAKEDADNRRAAQLKAWLDTKGTDAMRKRAARGLLPEGELIDAIRDEAYAPLDQFRRFERITDDEVHQLDEDGLDSDQDAVYETCTAKSANDEDIELIERIEAVMPGAVCTLMEHRGRLEDGTPNIWLSRCAVRVAIKVGELDFTREYMATAKGPVWKVES